MSAINSEKTREDMELSVNRSKPIESKENRSKRSKTKIAAIMVLILVTSLLFLNIGVRIASIHTPNGVVEWQSSNNQPYLEVSAETPFDLGYLTGQALSSEIYELWKILMLGAPQYGLKYWQLLDLARDYSSLLTQAERQEMEGIAKGASNQLGISLSFDDILLQNTWVDIFYGRLMLDNRANMGCTVIGTLNQNMSTMAGQTFDFGKLFEPTLSFVKHQIGDNFPVFGLRIGASLSQPMAMNAQGVAVFITLVITSVSAEVTTPLTIRSRRALEQASSASEFQEIFYTISGTDLPFSFTTLIVDNQTLISTKSLPNQTITLTNPSQIVQSNTFNETTWQEFLVDKEYSKDRQVYAEDLLNSAYTDDELTNAELLDILSDSPLISRHGENRMDSTTCAFMTLTNFGLGAPDRADYGRIPLVFS